ncbi:TIGR03086 family metal-binding protein [Spirillospora albida]|uniref:TIGR03086 family metal-binding protein n=1 Tax=Spirillospora albida TaxID=58123 RepID=UPI00055D2673|nr:TIGR03086 family metal-binding protein [Spirillospora albida]
MSDIDTSALRAQMGPATEAAVRIVREVPDDRLDAPTPCPDWDLRALVNHFLYWNACGETAARRRPPAGPGEDHDFTAEPGWADRFAEQAARTAAAWDDPAAWEGATSLTGGKDGMPASVIGGIVLSELVLHGWDVAAALGRDPGFPPGVLDAVWGHLVPTAEMGREFGAFGAEVPVPADAPLLHRVLGLAGRDPHWTP